MKKIGMFSICLWVLIAGAFASDSVYVFSYFKNNGQDGLHLAYSADGLKWKALKNDSSFLTPAVSRDKLIRDPCIIRGKDGLFHMVWTVSWNDRGIGYAQSRDLVNWSAQAFIPVMQHQDSARNCWAPEITVDPKRNRYLIYWATTIRGRYNADAKVENGYNHRLYYTLTRNFRHFSKTRLLYDKGFNVIDATIVPDGKRFVMFLKDETLHPEQKNIRVAFSKKINKRYGSPSLPITGKYWAEGPAAMHLDGTWVVYFDRYRDHRFGALQSPDLVNWKDISSEIALPPGIRHGSILKISREEFEVVQAAGRQEKR